MSAERVMLTAEMVRDLWPKAKDIVDKMHPVECDCAVCRGMCLRAPCLGTPLDIARIMAAGHGKKLAQSNHVAFAGAGVPPVKMIAPLMTSQGCAFLDEQGHCSLHSTGLKPTEGRLSSCQRTPEQSLSLTLSIIQTWLV